MISTARDALRGAWLLILFLGFTGCRASPSPRAPELLGPKPPLPRDVVMQAATPYYGLALGHGSPSASAEELRGLRLFEALKAAPLVCVGETHDSPRDHYVQLRVLSLLASHSASAGEQLGVGFEAFRRPSQAALDAFSSSTIDEALLLKRTDYEKNWGFDFALYRPLLELAKQQRVPLIALNAPREWTREIAKKGLAGVDPALRAELPKLDLDDAVHRQFFEAAMGIRSPQPHQKKTAPHGTHPTPSFENYYAAQVTWDETMAEAASQWFLAAEKTGQRARLLIFAGGGHCHESAIPRRLARRTGREVLSVRPRTENELDSRQKPSDPLPAPKDQDFDLILVSPSE